MYQNKWIYINLSKMLTHCCFAEFTPPVWFLCFTSFNHSLLIVNASCNFLIYCSVGAKFKTTISKFFARWGCCPAHPVTSSPTTMAGGGMSGARDSPLPMIVMAKQVKHAFETFIWSKKCLDDKTSECHSKIPSWNSSNVDSKHPLYYIFFAINKIKITAH